MKKEAKFILDKPRATGETHIFLKFSCKDSSLRYSTQHKINPEDWDSTSQRASLRPKEGLNKKEQPDYLNKQKAINGELDRLYRIVASYIESSKIMQKAGVYKQDLKKELDSKNDKEERMVVSKKHFFKIFQQLMDEATAGTLLIPRSQKRYTDGTVRSWGRAKARLLEFDPNIEFDRITIDTYTKFIQWCNSKSYSTNYIGSLLKDWRTIISHAYSKKYHSNLIHKHPEFKIFREISEMVYLNDDEIIQLYNHDLSSYPYQEVIRDRYIINLCNGLRVSDMRTLSIGNIKRNQITHINQKTSIKVVIPVHDLVTAIIVKYKGEMPKQYHQNVVNREIKKIAEKAGITEIVRYSKTIGGVNKKFAEPKWKLITNHTARRSMVTNALKFLAPQQVMPITGMTLNTLMKYNKITPEENADQVQDNSFFRIRK